MNIYKFAMQMEKDGEQFYRELADNCQLAGIKTILTMLANDEVKHFNVIAQLQKQAGISSFVHTTVLENAKNVFIRMKQEKANIIHLDSSDLELFRKALAIEEASRKFYLTKASNGGEGKDKQIFLLLAGEEEKHIRIMENIVEFVARPEPGNWLENAEWHHLDEY